MQRISQNIVLIALMTGLTCIGAFIRIPLLPVPITLQTLFVYISGILLGRYRGLISQGLYLIIGLAGMPVFSFGGGPVSILKPTFGYLLGFPIAAWVIGSVFQHFAVEPLKFGRILGCLSIGMIVILGTGLLGLIINTHWIAKKPIDFIHLLLFDVLIFIPVEIGKILVASELVMKLRPLIKTINT